MRRHAEIESDQMPGQDSFLDVITNIVGILILLVMIVGVRSSQAKRHIASNPSVELPQGEQPVRKVYDAAIGAQRNLQPLIHQVVNTRREVLLREREREILSTMVAQGEQEIAERRSQLNTQERRDFDIRRKLNEAQLTLEELTREQVALVSQPPDVEEIECEPTPLARAVTGKEVHVLLADDHVAVVPFEEMLELMKKDVMENIWRLRQQDQMDRTLGPVNGFRLRYWFVKTQVVARSESGNMMSGSIPRFSHCFFVPVATPVGEPAAEALLASSEMHQFLQRLDAGGTTVTIWTYPGNFERLREIKRAIRERGFQTAVRPLPPGMPIGASRTGSESLAE